MKKSKTKDNTILILCSDERTCYQLNEVLQYKTFETLYLNLFLQVLTQGPHFYLFMKALKQQVPFKKVAKSFSENQKLPELPSQKKTGVETRKKLKTGKANSTSISTSTESTSNEEDNEIEEFQSSYILTMSQMISENDGKESKTADDSEYVFEPCTQVWNQ